MSDYFIYKNSRFYALINTKGTMQAKMIEYQTYMPWDDVQIIK